jgi:hypothetical protein
MAAIKNIKMIYTKSIDTEIQEKERLNALLTWVTNRENVQIKTNGSNPGHTR